MNRNDHEKKREKSKEEAEYLKTEEVKKMMRLRAIEKHKENVKKTGNNKMVKGMTLNPAGKQKGTKNFKTILNMMLDKQKFSYWDDDTKKMYRITKREALARKIIDRALLDENIAWTKLAVETSEQKTEGGDNKPVINVNIANFKEMTIDDLLHTAGNPNNPNEGGQNIQG